MASLNTLRTKFGIVLSIVIARALLAFILSLKTEMGFSGNDPRVGVIDGEKINYSEYYDQYEHDQGAERHAQESDEQQSAMLANAAWQALIAKHVLDARFRQDGAARHRARASGDGQRPASVAGVLQRLRRSPHGRVQRGCRRPVPRAGRDQPRRRPAGLGAAQRAGPSWSARSPKYLGLVKGGVYVNALEVARTVSKAANKYFLRASGPARSISAVPDSLDPGDVRRRQGILQQP